MAHQHSHAHDHDAGHVVPEKTFLAILLALLVLTVVTVITAKMEMFNFGKWNIVLALVIASVKAALVILVFMHGKYENKLLWTYILIPFILLAIMIGGVFTDDPFRDDSKHFEVVAQTK